MVFPRTAEIADRGELSFRGSVQLLSIEAQSVEQTDGTKASSTVGFFPDWALEGHLGIGGCEAGLVGVDLGGLAELRCALLSQARGAPLSLAFSGAAGVAASAGIGFAPAARLGLDVSRRYGAVEPLLDVYLSSMRQAHFIQTGWVNDPFIGPSGVILGRQELRLSVPIGVAFHVDRGSVILGVEPWFVLAATSHAEVDPVPRSYTPGDAGLAFTLGFAYR